MSSPRARSRNSARAVRKMIGIPLVRSSSSSCSATLQPSMPGIITSSRTTSGCSTAALSRPVGPSAASTTSIPSASRLTRQRRRIGASSSMTSTFVMPVLAPLYPQRRALVARGGELERETRALALGRVHPDASAHRVDELLRDEETQPGAGSAVARGRLGAVELPEDPLALGGGDAHAFVDHAHLDPVGVATRADSH